MLAPDSSVRFLLDTMTGDRSALSMLTLTASRQHVAASFEVSRSQASPHRFGANFSHVKSPSVLEPLMLLAAVDVRVMQKASLYLSTPCKSQHNSEICQILQ